MRIVEHFIDGAKYSGSVDRSSDDFDPNTGRVQARVRLADAPDVARAVNVARWAQIEWAAVNPQRRARVLFEFKTLLEAHMDEIALLLSSDMGRFWSMRAVTFNAGSKLSSFPAAHRI
jgi:malonate-semialdehyde dehydrogenase (acetylating) / methylmalonate-semialdehyde dehydrogenase